MFDINAFKEKYNRLSEDEKKQVDDFVEALYLKAKEQGQLLTQTSERKPGSAKGMIESKTGLDDSLIQ
ncbi:MAG: DUF2281 domain-containing protein [Bacteroidetes bacterium]|nr:DUF2281 domain-containing protein [Bacteroidota bacterium]